MDDGLMTLVAERRLVQLREGCEQALACGINGPEGVRCSAGPWTGRGLSGVQIARYIGGADEMESCEVETNEDDDLVNEMNPLAELPNLGPKSQAMLVHAGISSLAQLRALGSVAAYIKVKQAGGNVSLNLLWALEGALSGEHWQVVAKEHRTSLLLALEEQERQPDSALYTEGHVARGRR